MSTPLSTSPFVANAFTPSQTSTPIAAGTEETPASSLAQARQRIADAIGNESDASAVMAEVDEVLPALAADLPPGVTVDQLVQMTLQLAQTQAYGDYQAQRVAAQNDVDGLAKLQRAVSQAGPTGVLPGAVVDDLRARGFSQVDGLQPDADGNYRCTPDLFGSLEMSLKDAFPAATKNYMDLQTTGLKQPMQVIYDLGRMASAAPGGDGKTWGPQDLLSIKARLLGMDPSSVPVVPQLPFDPSPPPSQSGPHRYPSDPLPPLHIGLRPTTP